MITAIRKRGKDFAAILVLIGIALAVAGLVLHNERLRFPFIEASPTTLKAQFTTAQAVTPGQGQTVRVSGVKVGDIAKVDLVGGIAVITMDIDPAYKHLVHTDASALLRPKTGLKDMFVELNPGSGHAPRAKPGFTIPLSRTLPDVNPDEIYGVLDADTRAYLTLLVNGAGRGLRGRGGDLAEVFRRFEPTHRDLARFATAVAARRHELRSLVTSLHRLNDSLAERRVDLAELVDSSSAVFHAFAGERTRITQAVRDLPAALRQTTATLGKVRTFANTLGPAARKLIPAVAPLPGANAALSDLAKATTPAIHERIRPFVRAARPVVRDLRPAASELATATPHLTQSFVVLNHLFNDLGFNPNGAEGPEVANRQEGFLFWIGWLDHQALTLFSTQDANGGYRPLFLTAPCSTYKQLVAEQGQALKFLLNLDPILDNVLACQKGASK